MRFHTFPASGVYLNPSPRAWKFLIFPGKIAGCCNGKLTGRCNVSRERFGEDEGRDEEGGRRSGLIDIRVLETNRRNSRFLFPSASRRAPLEFHRGEVEAQGGDLLRGKMIERAGGAAATSVVKSGGRPFPVASKIAYIRRIRARAHTRTHTRARTRILRTNYTVELSAGVGAYADICVIKQITLIGFCVGNTIEI